MRVLLVEDQLPLARVVVAGLKDAGIDVEVEHDGLSGLWRAREGSYDAIILDIMLPQMNGYQICQTLRDEGIWTPVLMLTAKDGEFDEAEALDTGADDFLRKPFAFVVLIARLHAIVRRGASARPNVLAIGSLTYNPHSGVVKRLGRVVELTRRESSLLEVLMRAEGSPVRRETILARVWGYDEEPSSNVVDVYVRYLRRKIDEPFDSSMIRTVRGVGYQIESDTHE